MNAIGKHTPGPWWVFDEPTICGKQFIAEVAGISGQPSLHVFSRHDRASYEVPHNARLIAASPDMLALLAEYAAPRERETFTQHAEWENDWARRVRELLTDVQGATP